MTLRASRFLVLPLALAMCAGASGQGALPKDSPFASQSAPGAPGSAPAETLEFAGVSTMGKKTDLVFHDKTTKKNHWVPVGETADGISVVSYDPEREQAVVKIGGTQKVLALRKAAPRSAPAAATMPASVPLNGAPPVSAPPLPLPGQPQMAIAPGTPPSAAPVPPAPAPAAPAQPLDAQAKQEQEARMLVSDLLEIGMAQRKAYEEAQRKAAEGTPPPSANAAAPVLTSPSGQPVAPTAPPAPGGR